MAQRDPHDVLGVERGATRTAIKAAWRRLARQHHPDLTGDDPEASRVATRQMAQINDAYAALTREPDRTTRGRAEDDGATFDAETGVRRTGPPRPKPTRPVTGRVDMSGSYRPRNETSSGGRSTPLTGQPPLRAERVRRDPLRASDPTGPAERRRVRGFRRPPPPPLRDALAHVVEFGKFHGHTLGQIAGFEPSYIDWLSSTVTRDPELVAAARVVRDDLDERGVQRRSHPSTDHPRSA
jgi:curved DNA-binding protein CbpA